jgi:integrase
MPTPKLYVARNGTKTWHVRFRHHGRNTSRPFATERKALLFCRDLEDPRRGVDWAVRMLDEETETTPTLDELFAGFIAWKTTGAKRVRSDRTIADYRRDWRLWVSPWFGHEQAGRVTDADVDEWITAMLAGTRAPTDPKDHTRTPLEPKTVRDRHALLHSVYSWAARPPHSITNDPCRDTVLPKRRKKPPKGMLPAEWDALYRMLLLGDEDAADLALFLHGSGWRWSEVVALTTYDVEDNGDRLWVNMRHVMRRGADNRLHDVEDGKGDASLRRIELDPEAAAMVRRRVAAAKPGGLVFTTGISRQNGLGGSQWRYSNFVDRHWRPAVEAANLGRKPTPHWLRHTHVGWLIMAGASLPEIQARIGHASINTTISVYAGLINDVQPDTLSRLAAMRRPAAALDADAGIIEGRVLPGTYAAGG